MTKHAHNSESDQPAAARLQAKLDELAQSERQSAGVSFESHVFASSVESLAGSGSVPADVRALASMLDELAETESQAAGLSDRVLEASLAALQQSAALRAAGEPARAGSRHGVSNPVRAHSARWSIAKILGSPVLRMAAALALVAGGVGVYVSVQRAEERSRQTALANAAAESAKARLLAASVDESIKNMWDDLNVASEKDWDESYDLNAMEHELSQSDNRSRVDPVLDRALISGGAS